MQRRDTFASSGGRTSLSVNDLYAEEPGETFHIGSSVMRRSNDSEFDARRGIWSRFLFWTGKGSERLL